MRNSLLIIIFVAVSQLSALAQSTPVDCKTSRCLTGMSVTITPELMQVGETATAIFEFDKPERSDLTFDWTISGGTILEGQGTRKIKVTQRDENAGQPLTVAVSVGGLPEICQRYVSATQSIAKNIDIFPVDDYHEQKFEREKDHLDYFALRLKDQNSMIGLIVLDFNPIISQAKINSRIIKVFSYLNNVCKIESNRLKFALSVEKRQNTQLWMFPRDSIFVPYNSKLIIDEDLAKILSPQNPKRRKSR